MNKRRLRRIKFTSCVLSIFLSLLLLLGVTGNPAVANPDGEITKPAGKAILEERTSRDGVKLNGDRIRIEADQLTYDVGNKTITAEGNVTVTTEDSVYHTDSIIYNTDDYSGMMTTFTATVNADPRDLKVSGSGAKLSENETLVSEATLTRCIKENPHYQLTAREIRINGRQVNLKKVVLRLKGVPVFYLPKLSLNLDKRLPSLETGFSGEDGFKLKYNYLAAITSHINWSLEGELTSRDESKVGFGLESTNTAYQNKFKVLYNLDSFWEINDRYAYENDLLLFTVDGQREFSDDKERTFGVGLTRKYWETLLGRWQIGVLARNASKEEDATSYGGFYTGWRLDYNPRPNMVFSYLGITSHTDRQFGDLMDDYGLGDNWLYNISFPIYKEYSFEMNGVYNSDSGDWIHQIYSIHHESCCFSTYLGYDVAEDSIELSWNIKF